MFKIKDGYKLELQTPEMKLLQTMKLFDRTKKINRQSIKWIKSTKS